MKHRFDFELNCCEKCKTSAKNDDFPRVYVDACYNNNCECHRNTVWHDNQVECGNECHYQYPYGFVPEAGCEIHDLKI